MSKGVKKRTTLYSVVGCIGEGVPCTCAVSCDFYPGSRYVSSVPSVATASHPFHPAVAIEEGQASGIQGGEPRLEKVIENPPRSAAAHACGFTMDTRPFFLCDIRLRQRAVP